MAAIDGLRKSLSFYGSQMALSYHCVDPRRSVHYVLARLLVRLVLNYYARYRLIGLM